MIDEIRERLQTQSWVIAKPSVGHYTPDCLRLESRVLPPLEDGELLLKTIYVSLDPTYLNWLRLKESYVVPLAVGDVMKGVVLAVVEQSRAPDFLPGDVVTAVSDWAMHSIVKTGRDQMVPPAKIAHVPGVPLSAYLTIFSHIGLVAVIGLDEIAKPKPGEVVLVSGAAGAVGTLVVEIAKARGCRVIGIAGGSEKCKFLRDELGADGTIDYKNEDVEAAIGRLCPNGVDVYFDNVGGPILDATLLHLAMGARILVCGEISQYDIANPSDHYGIKNLFRLVLRSARMEGFIPPAYEHRFAALFESLGKLYAEGAITHRPHVIDGLEQIAEAMGLLPTGGNHGKLMAKISADPWSEL